MKKILSNSLIIFALFSVGFSGCERGAKDRSLKSVKEEKIAADKKAAEEKKAADEKKIADDKKLAEANEKKRLADEAAAAKAEEEAKKGAPQATGASTPAGTPDTGSERKPIVVNPSPGETLSDDKGKDSAQPGDDDDGVDKPKVEAKKDENAAPGKDTSPVKPAPVVVDDAKKGSSDKVSPELAKKAESKDSNEVPTSVATAAESMVTIYFPDVSSPKTNPMEMAEKKGIKNPNINSVVRLLMQKLKTEAATGKKVAEANTLLMLQLRNCSSANDCPLYERTTQKSGFVSGEENGKVNLITSASLIDAYKGSLPKAKVGTTLARLKGNLLLGMNILIVRAFPKTASDPYLVNPTATGSQKGTVKLKTISEEALKAIYDGKYTENSDKIADHTVTLEMTPTPGMEVKALTPTNARCEETLVAKQDLFLPMKPSPGSEPKFLQTKIQATEGAVAAKIQTRMPLEAKLPLTLEGAPILSDRGEYLGVLTKASDDSKGLSLGSCISTK